MDANHRQMTKCCDRKILQYRAIFGVLEHFMSVELLDKDETIPHKIMSTESHERQELSGQIDSDGPERAVEAEALMETHNTDTGGSLQIVG